MLCLNFLIKLLMNKYDKNLPVDNKLIFKIEKDYKFFWKNDRTKSIEKNDRFLINLINKIS